MTETSKILLIYTGGTIGMVKNYDTGALQAFDFDKLLQHIPELRLLNCQIESFSFQKPIDSSNMNTKHWVKLASIIEKNYTTYDGFVVLHGSDTMSYTASTISFMFENLAKPVIFTGSQLPIGDLRTDAKENLITSVEIASAQKNGKPIVAEVCLYFEYKLYRANRTTKISSEQFEAFSSPNYSQLAESGVHLKFNTNALYQPKTMVPLKVRKKLSQDIVLLKLFPGITKQTVACMLSVKNLKGVVLETYGSGNAPSNDWFVTLLQKAINNGIHIVNVTQCVAGSVLQGRYETSVKLKKIGIISGKDITTESAIAKLMYLLGEGVPNQRFKEIFEGSLRGEMS